MLNMHFLNVDNGDCIVLEYIFADERYFGLIDCNRTPKKKSPALDKLQSLGAEKLQFVCITHPDQDHYTGIIDVLRFYKGKIGTFLTFPLSSLLTDTKRLKEYAQKLLALAERGDDEEIASRNLEFLEILQTARDEFLPGRWIEVSGNFNLLSVGSFKGVDFYGIGPPPSMRGAIVDKVLSSERFAKIDNNEVSIAMQINYARRTVILGGDAIDDNWIAHRRYRQNVGKEIIADVVKLPHHGSRKDNSADTLNDFFKGKENAVAVISAGGRSHPDFETMELLKNLPCTRLCTNLFNPSERSVKRIYNNEELASPLRHYLNVFANLLVGTRQVCKGDICISIHPDGAITSSVEFNAMCGCTTSLSQTGAPDLPSLPALSVAS